MSSAMSTDEFRTRLADLAKTCGEGRFFVVKHQPRKKSTPVRVELRQALVGTSEPRESLSTLVGYEETFANEDKIYDAALLIKSRSARIEDLIGVYG